MNTSLRAVSDRKGGCCVRNSERYGERPLECRTYTVNEVARILGVSRTQAYRLVQEGLFKSVRIGNAIRIPKRSFDRWLEPLDL